MQSAAPADSPESSDAAALTAAAAASTSPASDSPAPSPAPANDSLGWHERGSLSPPLRAA